MDELHKRLLELSADAYTHYQVRGDEFALRVADMAAGLALKAKRLAANDAAERTVERTATVVAAGAQPQS